MDNEKLQKFADQLGADPDAIVDRWQGRPDLVMDDIFRVRDIDTGKPRELELFDVQRKLIHGYFYSDSGTVNAYKGRRIGYSFAVVACFLLEAMFFPNSFYPIVSNSLSQAKDRIADIEQLIDDAKIEIPTQKTNKDEIVLWNDSSFMAYSSDSDTSRGADSGRAVLMDEMAFIEDEEQASRAFGAFLALGNNRKMVQVSTPNTKNDEFMETHRRGSSDGDNGILSIKQPTFANAEEIDIHTSLYDQELEPVRPELNIDQIENERLKDPEGFGQEYLCRPVSDEYRFFGENTLQRAQERARANEYQLGVGATKFNGVRRVMGVDIGINRDDTVISVTDHENDERRQRLCVAVDDDTLRRAGVKDPDRANANHIAKLIGHIHSEMGVDLVILDKGGVGQTFERIIERQIGRGVVGFDFSDKGAVKDMMEDTNVALRNDNVSLVPKDRLYDEMAAIVKEKRDQYAKPKFSGKDYSESGKDDMAMATVLSTFPPNQNTEPVTRPGVKERTPDDEDQNPSQASKKPNGKYNPSFGATSVQRTSRSRRNQYQSKRHR